MLQSILSSGVPVILLLQAWKDDSTPPYPIDWDDGHFVVAVGFDSKYIYFEDPWILGSLTYMTKSELLTRWHDHIFSLGKNV